ncbi:MAG TPA: thioredoxin family protein [bacterium]
MNWREQHEKALPYLEFLTRYGTEEHRARWQRVYDTVQFTGAQREMLAGFPRQMNLLCLSGTWCGDCVRECPILQRIAEESPVIDLRFIDRDDNPELRDALAINNGHRVPVVVFLSEDFFECARYGERTLATYRKMAAERLGPACPTGIIPPGEDYMDEIVADWLREVERVQLMLRLSARLRELHGD